MTEIQERVTIWGLQRMCEKQPPKEIIYTSENNPDGLGFIKFNVSFDSIMCQTNPDIIALYNSNSSGKMCVSFHNVEKISIESLGNYWKTVTIFCTSNIGTTTNRKEYTVIFKY